MLRLDKYLTEAGVGSRSDVKKLVRAGRVRVNDNVVKSSEDKVDENADVITVDGKRVSYAKFLYYMMNKPRGVVSATEDKREKSVISLIVGDDPGRVHGAARELFPVGRLDKDTEGLLLITNDGDLAHRLLAPGRHVDKLYYAEYSGTLSQDAERCFEEGIELSDFTTLPAKLERAGEQSCYVTLCEGKFHQVKRMIAAVGGEVTYLKRLSMGNLKLDEKLAPGEWRELSEEEIKALC